MKRFLLMILSLVTLASAVFVPISASAKTKDDVLKLFKSIPASKYVYDDVEQIANNHPLTSEQYDKLYEYCEEVKALFPEDKGSSFHSYSAEVQDRALKIVHEVADYLGLRVETKLSDDPEHSNDVVIFLYDANGKLMFRYDGDEVQKTDVAEKSDYTLYAIMSSLVIVAAIIAFAFLAKKRNINKTAA